MEKLVIVLVCLGCALANASCPDGDHPRYRINGRYCDQLGYGDRQLCYGGSVRHYCCATCQRLETRGAPRGCLWGDRLRGCDRLSSRQCRLPYYNQECCHSCQNARRYCRDDPNMTINGYKCPEFLRYKGKHHCYTGQVLDSCCASCERLRTTNAGHCKFGDRKTRQFTDSRTKVIYRCDHLRGGWLHKCAQGMVREDCCETCRDWESKVKRDVTERDVTEVEEDKSEVKRDIMDILTG